MERERKGVQILAANQNPRIAALIRLQKESVALVKGEEILRRLKSEIWPEWHRAGLY